MSVASPPPAGHGRSPDSCIATWHCSPPSSLVCTWRPRRWTLTCQSAGWLPSSRSRQNGTGSGLVSAPSAVDLMVALLVTSLLRARLGHQAWRTVHWLAYACWPLALVHGFAAGSDTGTVWARAVYVVSLLAVVAAVAWRLRRRPVARPTPISPHSLSPSRQEDACDHSRPFPAAPGGRRRCRPRPGGAATREATGGRWRARRPTPAAPGRGRPFLPGPSGAARSTTGRRRRTSSAPSAASGLRGRGGARFPTGRKMAAVAVPSAARRCWSPTAPRENPCRTRTAPS